MNHSSLLQGSKNQLVRQLVYFDEERSHFLDQYYPEHNRKRSSIERMLTAYSEALEHVLQQFDESNLRKFALIGSTVEIRYEEDGTHDAFTIVFPHKTDPDRNRVSFLSPIGFQLLLTQKGESYVLELPSGELRVNVTDIRFANAGDLD